MIDPEMREKILEWQRTWNQKPPEKMTRQELIDSILSAMQFFTPDEREGFFVSITLGIGDGERPLAWWASLSPEEKEKLNREAHERSEERKRKQAAGE